MPPAASNFAHCAGSNLIDRCTRRWSSGLGGQLSLINDPAEPRHAAVRVHDSPLRERQTNGVLKHSLIPCRAAAGACSSAEVVAVGPQQARGDLLLDAQGIGWLQQCHDAKLEARGAMTMPVSLQSGIRVPAARQSRTMERPPSADVDALPDVCAPAGGVDDQVDAGAGRARLFSRINWGIAQDRFNGHHGAAIVAQGLDPKVVQTLLGHSDIEMTEMYLNDRGLSAHKWKRVTVAEGLAPAETA